MSNLKPESHEAPVEISTPPADGHAVNWNSYVRRCQVIFLVVFCTTLAMVATSYAHIGNGWTLRVTLILATAVFNAFLVAGYLMHLLSEKRLVYTVLSFTVVFFIGLMGLTLWAMSNFPTGTVSR